MHTPTRIASHKAVVEFLPENLPFIYIDTNIIYYMIVNKTHVQIEKKKGKKGIKYSLASACDGPYPHGWGPMLKFSGPR